MIFSLLRKVITLLPGNHQFESQQFHNQLCLGAQGAKLAVY